MRLLLARTVRTADVRALAERLALLETREEPRVFPGRGEPARVDWETGDGLTRATLVTRVDPWRRLLLLQGADAAEVASVVAGTLGVLQLVDVRRSLLEAGDEEAFRAAFELAFGWPESALESLEHALYDRHDAYVQHAVVRAIESVGSKCAVVVLDRARACDDLPGEVRAVAGAAASELRYRAR